MDWVLGRMKAWAALAIPAIVTAIIGAFETSFSFEVPSEIKLFIVSTITGWCVYMVPNKQAA